MGFQTEVQSRANKSKEPLSYIERCKMGVQGWLSGESTRFPPMWPGFDSQIRRHMSVEFVLYSAPRGFLRVLRFPLSSETKI